MIELYQGDCLDVMRGFEPACMDLTVTSPPYDNLRKYHLDKFVVWRYDLPHEKKLEIIQELRARGVKPVASPE